MTKHDTWVFLKTPCPYDAIKPLFPRGFPMRDPFPMTMAESEEAIVLWVIDIERLTPQQTYQIANVIAQKNNADIDEVMDEAIAARGFGLSEEWIENMEVGPEGYARTMELKEFLEAHPLEPTPESKQAYREFIASQIERWIDGDEIPPPLPATIDEVDPNLVTPELAAAIERNRVKQILADGNYSVLDVLLGRTMVDTLNELDPNHFYDLVDEEDFE